MAVPLVSRLKRPAAAPTLRLARSTETLVPKKREITRPTAPRALPEQVIHIDRPLPERKINLTIPALDETRVKIELSTEEVDIANHETPLEFLSEEAIVADPATVVVEELPVPDNLTEPEAVEERPLDTVEAAVVQLENLLGLTKAEDLEAISSLTEAVVMASERLQVLYEHAAAASEQEITAIETCLVEWYGRLLSSVGIELEESAILAFIRQTLSVTETNLFEPDLTKDKGTHELKAAFDFAAMLQRISDEMKRRLRTLRFASYVLQTAAA